MGADGKLGTVIRYQLSIGTWHPVFRDDDLWTLLYQAPPYSPKQTNHRHKQAAKRNNCLGLVHGILESAYASNNTTMPTKLRAYP